jgi:flagellar export protein FliJ
MKRFVWRLQKVLDLKTKQERLKQTELFRITERLAQKRGELLIRERVLQDIMKEIIADSAGTRVARQEFILKHAVTDDERIQRLREEIAALEQEQSRKTEEVLDARRYKESLQRLRAEAQGRYAREQDRLEQKELDDRTTTAFARKGTARHHAM